MRITDLQNIQIRRMRFRERLAKEYRNCRDDVKMSVPAAAYYAWRLARAKTPNEWLEIHMRRTGELKRGERLNILDN